MYNYEKEKNGIKDILNSLPKNDKQILLRSGISGRLLVRQRNELKDNLNGTLNIIDRNISLQKNKKNKDMNGLRIMSYNISQPQNINYNGDNKDLLSIKRLSRNIGLWRSNK